MFHSHVSWALKVGDGQPRQGPARTEIRPHEAHADGAWRLLDGGRVASTVRRAQRKPVHLGLPFSPAVSVLLAFARCPF